MVTTNALARLGILSVGAIHKHLGTREEIIRTLLERRGEQLRNALLGVQNGNKAVVIRGQVQVVVEQICSHGSLIEVLELERRRLSSAETPGFGSALTASLTKGFADPGVTVRKPVDRIAGLLSEMVISLAFGARNSGLASRPAIEGIIQASMAVVDDLQWWS